MGEVAVTVSVCQSGDLAVIGQLRWALSFPEKGVNGKGEVEASLRVCLLPLKAGQLSFPPIKLVEIPSQGGPGGAAGDEEGAFTSIGFPNDVNRGIHSLLAIPSYRKRQPNHMRDEHPTITQPSQFILVPFPT